MEKEPKNLQMEIFILEVMLMVNQLDMDNIIGQMAVFLKVVLKMVWDMETEYGNEDLVKVINMKVNMLMIRNLDMGFLLGQVAIYIKEIIYKM